MTAKTVVDVILGEAKAGSYQDMLAIASVISNRATGAKTSWQDVVARTSEFNAYGKALPSGVNRYRSQAQKAIDEVKKNGPIHNATFYATPKAKGNLPKGLQKVTATDGHVYFTDPQQRPIYTASGLKRINYQQVNSATPTLTAYNETGLPDGSAAPIPAGLFGAAPKSSGLGLAALNPSGTIGGELSYVRRNQKIDPNSPISAAISGAGKEIGKDIQVTSGYRSPSYNRSVGGAKNSLHVQKKAMDISMAGMSNKQRQELVQNLTQRGAGGFITYDSMPDILHVDMRKRKSEFRPHFMHNKSKDFMHRAPGWFKEMDRNDGVLLPKEKIPTPQPQTSAAPFGRVERQELGPAKRTPSASDYQDYRQSSYQAPKKSEPAPVDFSTNLYPSGQPQASDYSNYQMMKKHSALPLGMAAPKPVARPTDLPKPTYTPKATDYSNYMMNVKQPTIPTPAARPADLGPMAVIDGPVGKPIQNVPIPAPTLKRESRFDKAKRTFGNNLKEQLKPQTIAARGAGALIGGLLGGPLGARAGSMFGPQIAQRLNGNRQQGLFGGMFDRSNQPLNTFQSAGSNSSNRMQNAMYGPRGSSNTASNGSQSISLGNGQYRYYSPKADKWSINGSPNVNKSAPVGNNIFSSIFGGSKKD